ncbi:hypothetical protein KDA14_05285, partial [Candidatus Saccharibacteria bacterium]|nr:hypothetical protein [Candidatus Saccharibacteria bacterium]
VAHDALVAGFDVERGIPMRAASHTDLWPGDRWAEAYIAAGEPNLAAAVMNTIARSVRPDGSVPHLMQGSHIRGGIETRWIDRQVYRMQGNGAIHLPNGEWVTEGFAPPTQAISALALHEAGVEIPGRLQAAGLMHATETLYDSRGTMSGLIVAHKIDELTRSTANLARAVKLNGVAKDPAVNALLVKNNRALRKLADAEGEPLDEVLSSMMHRTERTLVDEMQKTVETKVHYPEEVLAAARLDEVREDLTEQQLIDFFAAPDAQDKHPEQRHLTMAESIEVARLTANRGASQEYLERIVKLVNTAGAAALTRFEGIGPDKNAVANKMGRKQAWLPTAAEVVQISSVTA